MRVWGGLALWLLVTFAAAATGALFTDASWYGEIARPSWSPSPSVFGPVWTVLYAMMAIAAWIVWKEKGFSGAGRALGLYFAQLLLNAAWSPLFFGLHAIGLALIDIIVLWAMILATIVEFRKHRALAAWLLVPYLLWVTFAGALNAAILRLN
ncbi:MAG: TspO/MBR family protein [Thermoanaerobaculia bacterium]